ncbi:MAG: MG2 domain-containing protein, partial [Chthoniobacterales bacterium]
MKRLAWIFAALVALALPSIAQEDEEASEKKPNPNSSAGGVSIDPQSGEISPGMEITLTFPRAMVATELIDVGNQTPPIVSQPAVEGTFLWKSQTEGVFSVNSVVAGAEHHFRLASGLKEASGAPFSVPKWQADFTAPKFTITTDNEERKHLGAKPQMTLDASYPVRLTEAAEHIYFQDRDSRERLPVEIIQRVRGNDASSSLEEKEFGVSPREPLPAGHSYDLIVNGLLEAKSRQPLPYLGVFPAGTTESLQVAWVGAFHHALEEPSIIIKFNDDIDPDEATPKTIDVQPPIPEMKMLASGDDVTITGDFDLKQHYTITISPELKGDRGYGLPAPSRWGATFRAIEPCLVFPGSKVFVRARQELRLAFFQMNTPAVTWRLARIPPEKLAPLTKRVTEFEKQAVDPITGTFITDPRTGFTKQFQTELLVDAFELPVVATGTTDAVEDDEPVRRDVSCPAPAGATLSGAYLFEASAKLPDGRVVGNRTIVCASDFLLTEKRTQAEVKLRVAKMADAKPIAGVTVHALTEENMELGRAVTDANGLATFRRDAVLPPKGKQLHLFIADTSAGPALQFASASAYSSGSDELPRQPQTHIEIVTDRNLYRPGQPVKMKGIARDFSDRDLAMPRRGDVHWRVMDAESDRVMGEGSATLNDYGAWDGEWTIPGTAKLGHYKIRCKIGDHDYDGSAVVSVEEYRVPLFSVEVDADAEIGTAAHAKVSSAYFHGAPNVGARVHWKATWSIVTEISEKDSLHRYNQLAQLGPRIDPEQEASKSAEGDAQLDPHGLATLACESPFKNDAAVGRSDVSWKIDITSADGQTITGGAMQQIDVAPVRLGVSASEGTTGDGVKVKIDAINQEAEPVQDVPVRVELFHVTTKTVKEQIAPFVYRYRNTDTFTKVESHDSRAPAELTLKTPETGRYAVAVSATNTKTP